MARALRRPYLEWKLRPWHDHRERVGGYWSLMGGLQMELLQKHGLAPESKVLDVGCGALRLGRLLIPYLDEGGYTGVDVSWPLIKRGLRKEVKASMVQEQRPHLTTEWRNVETDSQDMAIATSVFTHIPVTDIQEIMAEAARVLKPGGVFLASYFPYGRGGRDFPTFDDQDPYHHIGNDIVAWMGGHGFVARQEFWPEHPRGQELVVGRLVSAAEPGMKGRQGH